MTAHGIRAIVPGVVLAAATLLATATPAAAECMGFDRWPSFTEAARTAKRILVGEVVESYGNDSADNAITFRVRVGEVLRGPSVTSLEFHDVVWSGAPLTVCPRDSILRVRVGDVIGFAFDARVSSSPDPVLAVTWIRGTPHDFLMPGAETLSLAKIRALAGLPATDTLPEGPVRSSEQPLPWLLVAGLVGSLALLIGVRQKRA